MKKSTEENGGPYPIPTVFYAKTSKFLLGLLVFLDLDTLLLIILIPSNGKFQAETYDILVFFGYFLFLTSLHYFFIIRQFLRKEYIELNDSSIKVKLIFKKEKTYEWDRVKQAEVVIGNRGWRHIKITGLEPIDELFWKTTSILIPLEIKFSSISENRFLHTIDKMRTMQGINK